MAKISAVRTRTPHSLTQSRVDAFSSKTLLIILRFADFATRTCSQASDFDRACRNICINRDWRNRCLIWCGFAPPRSMDAPTASICTGKTCASVARRSSVCMDWMHGRSRPTIPTANARLAWTEAVTNLRDGRVPDEAYEKVRTVFTEKELAYQAQKRELKQGA